MKIIRATALLFLTVLSGLLLGCSTAASRLVHEQTGRLIGIKGGIESHGPTHAGDTCWFVVQTTIGTYTLLYQHHQGVPAEESIRSWLAALDLVGGSPRLEILYESECDSKWAPLPYNKNGEIALFLDEHNRGPVFPFDERSPGVIVCGGFGEYPLGSSFRQEFDIKLDIPFDCAIHEYYVGNGGTGP